MKIGFAGDFFIAQDVATDINIGQRLRDYIDDCDEFVVNLEGPVFNNHEPRRQLSKVGPNLCGAVEALDLLAEVGINNVCLANNHIMDFGVFGLHETLKELKVRGIQSFGAGENIDGASTPLVLSSGDVTVGLISVCENEFSSASGDFPGAFGFDLIRMLREIKKLQKTVDHIILVYHGGHERYAIPSPNQTHTFRFLAESGLSAIISHHSHCFAGFETWGGVPIVYGLGNFVFPTLTQPDTALWGGLAKVAVSKASIELELSTVSLDLDSWTVDEASPADCPEFIAASEKATKALKTPAFLTDCWNEYVDGAVRDGRHLISPVEALPHRYLRGLCYRLGITEAITTQRHIKMILNKTRCESLRELMIASLDRGIK